MMAEAPRTVVQELAGWIKKCGYHCRGESVPDHVCAPVVSDPIADDGAVPVVHTGHQHREGHSGPAMGSVAGSGDRTGSPANVMGRGGLRGRDHVVVDDWARGAQLLGSGAVRPA